MRDKSLLVRFRQRDTREGVTRATMKKIASVLDLSETQAVHRALAEFASRVVPRYAVDDGPISDEQHGRITRLVRRMHGKAKVVASLFDVPRPAVKPRASKRVSASRAR